MPTSLWPDNQFWECPKPWHPYPACRGYPTIYAMEKLIAQDQQKILACLQDGSLTAAEISQRVHLSIPRVTQLIQNLHAQGAVQTFRCAKGSHGRRVNLWELHAPFKPQE